MRRKEDKLKDATDIILPSTSTLLGCVFPSGFPTKFLYAFLTSPMPCYTSRPSHPALFNYPNSIWRRAQIMKLIM